MYKKLILGLYLAVLLPASAGAQTKIDPSRYAPVPSATQGPAIPDKGYLVEEIRGGVYWVTEGIYQAVFATTGASATMHIRSPGPAPVRSAS